MTGKLLCTRELPRINLKFGMEPIFTATEAQFAPNPNSEGSMLIYTGNINSKLASGELFAYYEVLQVMKVLWEEVSRNQARVAEAILVE